MRRKIYDKLLAWKENPQHKPLILEGARQVGKTWIVNDFGNREYSSMVYVNCAESEAMKDVVERDSDPFRILQGIKAISGRDIVPGKTLLFLDEIQEAIHALPALKSFHERVPELDIIVAGSLLGVAMHEGVSFPVGKVDELLMHPLDFEEFLWGIGKDALADLIKDGEPDKYLPFHNQLNDLLKNYFFIGGMPEVVRSFAENASYLDARRKQRSILNGYAKDFSKHIDSDEMSLKISLVWKALPAQIAKENKKFIFSAIRPSARARDYEVAVEWLEDAGLASRVTRMTQMKRPAEFYSEEDSFKLFPLDCGLLGAMMGVGAAEVVTGENIFSEYKGAFTETYMYQQLASNYGDKIHYFSNESSTAEIDFCIEAPGLVPIEVKGGRNLTAKSIIRYVCGTPGSMGYRFSDSKPHSGDGITDIPLYCACAFAREMTASRERSMIL